MTVWTTTPTFTGFIPETVMPAVRCLACMARNHQACTRPTTAGCCCPKYIITVTAGVS